MERTGSTMAAEASAEDHAPLPCIEGRGASSKWQQSQTNVKRIFNMFRKHHPSAAKLASKDWDESPKMSCARWTTSFMAHSWHICWKSIASKVEATKGNFYL